MILRVLRLTILIVFVFSLSLAELANMQSNKRTARSKSRVRTVNQVNKSSARSPYAPLSADYTGHWKGVNYPVWIGYKNLSKKDREHLISLYNQIEVEKWMARFDNAAYFSTGQWAFDALGALASASPPSRVRPWNQREVARALKRGEEPVLITDREGKEFDAPPQGEVSNERINLLQVQIRHFAQEKGIPTTTIGVASEDNVLRAKTDKEVEDEDGEMYIDDDRMDLFGYMMEGEKYFANRPGAWEEFKKNHPDYKNLTSSGLAESERLEAKRSALESLHRSCASAQSRYQSSLKSESESYSKAVSDCNKIENDEWRARCLSAVNDSHTQAVQSINKEWLTAKGEHYCGRDDDFSRDFDRRYPPRH